MELGPGLAWAMISYFVYLLIYLLLSLVSCCLWMGLFVFCLASGFGSPTIFKPRPNGLTSRCKFWTCIELVFHLAPTCVNLHRLASTCDELCGLALTLVQLKFASRCKFLPFGHPAQVDTSWSQVICCYENALTDDMREIYGFLRLASRLLNPFGHPSQVRTQVLVL